MDTFPKLAYKKKEYQERHPLETNAEQLEYSKKVAQEKLSKIMGADFMDFAVRYVNIDEYRELLETGNFGGWGEKEVTLHGSHDVEGFQNRHSGIPETFREFLKKAPHSAVSYTDWWRGDDLIQAARSIVPMIHRAMREDSGAPKKEKLQTIRLRILESIDRDIGWNLDSPYKAIQNESSNSIANRMDFLTATQLDDLRERIRKTDEETAFVDPYDLAFDCQGRLSLSDEQTNETLAFIEAYYHELTRGEENLRILRRLKEDPAYIEAKGALREIANAFVHVVEDRRSRSKENRQYQIALIFDTKTYGFKSSPNFMRHARWGSFHDDPRRVASLSETEKKKGLLAAISVVPLKDLANEMVELERGSADFAHPVFDIVGEDNKAREVLRWPK